VLSALGKGVFSSWGYQPTATDQYIGGGANLYERQRRARLDVGPARDRGGGARDPSA
jgi:hypothetical protein